MQKIMSRSLLAALALAASAVSLQAEDGPKKEGCSAVAAKTDCKLLKGVVHLKDDDVRFARKGGGVVFIDPTTGPADALAVKAGLLKPDLILITHPHGDHFQPAILQEYIKANPQVVLAGPAEVVKLAQEKGIAGMLVVAINQTYTLAGFEFSTVPGRIYTVIYSDDSMATWQAATPSLTATATVTQWYDDGPPKTLSKPFSIGIRLYMVIANP